MLKRSGIVSLLLTSIAVAMSGSHVSAADGDLDRTFGNDGIQTTVVGSASLGYDVAIQPDGKIVVAVQVFNGSDNDFGLVRYNGDGSLDTSFDGDGLATYAVGSGGDYPTALLLQDDGRILIGGYSFNGTNNDFAVVRVTSNGTLDPTFGSGGKVITPISSGNDYGYDLAVQSDGKIIQAGYVSNASFDYAVVRYTPDGVLDNSFGSGGTTVFDYGSSQDYAYALAVQSDDKIVVVGSTETASSDIGIARLEQNGTLDASFGIGGKVTANVGVTSFAESVLIQPDGKIIAVGTATSSNDDFLLVRFDVDGDFDQSFGTNGIVITPMGSGADLGFDATLQSDGKIVVVGSTIDAGQQNFALARYTSGGQLDRTFGNSGKRINDITAGDDEIYAVAIQSDGKIVTAGYSRLSGNDVLKIARYEATSTLSTLSNLATSSDLNETFQASTLSYTATVPNAVKTFSVTPTLVERNGSITVNGVASGSGTPSSAALVVGTNTITIKVVAQDATTSTTYTVTVIRDVGTLKVKKNMTAKALLATADVALARGAKTTLSIKKSSRKNCSVAKGRVRGIKTGNCQVRVVMTPKPTKKTPKPKPVRTQVTIRII